MKDTGVWAHLQRQQVSSERWKWELTELFWRVAARLLASVLTTKWEGWRAASAVYSTALFSSHYTLHFSPKMATFFQGKVGTTYFWAPSRFISSPTREPRHPAENTRLNNLKQWQNAYNHWAERQVRFEAAISHDSYNHLWTQWKRHHTWTLHFEQELTSDQKRSLHTFQEWCGYKLTDSLPGLHKDKLGHIWTDSDWIIVQMTAFFPSLSGFCHTCKSKISQTVRHFNELYLELLVLHS